MDLAKLHTTCRNAVTANVRFGAKAEPLACRNCSAELYSIPHIISGSFYGPCHHASRSINALSPTAVCLFTPKSHPSNKFHPSPHRSPAVPTVVRRISHVPFGRVGGGENKRGQRGGEKLSKRKENIPPSPLFPSFHFCPQIVLGVCVTLLQGFLMESEADLIE